MHMITTLYGQALTLGLVACAFALMFSADAGREIAKRCGVSILLLCLGNMLWPPGGVDFSQAAMRMLLAFTAILAALIWLVHPRNAARLLRWVGALGVGLFLFAFALHSIIVGL